MQETQVRSLNQEDSLEKGMKIHFSSLAWRISWTEEPGVLHTVHGSHKRVGYDWATKQQKEEEIYFQEIFSFINRLYDEP